MKTDEIMEMAREAGLLPDNAHPTPETRAMRKRCEVVKHFAARVAAKEREACAEIAETEDVASTDDPFGVQSCIADAIRARGTKEGV